jgi:hypothetical protein
MKLSLFKNSRTLLLNLTWLILLIFICLFIVPVSLQVILNLPFPTITDQDSYLLTAKPVVESGLFFERSPIYSSWLGLIYIINGDDMASLYHNEKIASIIIFSSLMFILGWRLFDKWTALCFFAWAWNCKYLIVEPNGSHAMASIFLILAFIFLSFRNKLLRPFFIFMLVLSAWCRSEMWVVIFIFSIVSAFSYLKEMNFRIKVKQLLTSGQVQTSIFIVISCITLLFFFKANKFQSEPGRFSIAYSQNFAVNYVERNNLRSKFPDPWSSWPEILNEYLPGAITPVEILKKYPQEFILHILYNIKLSVFRLPGIVIGSVNYFLFGFMLFYLSLNFYFTERNVRRLTKSHRILMGSTFVLVLMSYFFKVAMRYYIQLIPVLMILFVWASYISYIEFSRKIKYHRSNVKALDLKTRSDE